MALELISAQVDDEALGAHIARTRDGGQLSLLFDALVVGSQASDLDMAPQVRQAEVTLACRGSGWVSVQLRGMAVAVGGHGYAHVTGWVNGRRLKAAAQPVDEPFAIAVAAPVHADGQLRLSLLLLAQRDVDVASSGAECAVDSVDVSVLPARAPRPTEAA